MTLLLFKGNNYMNLNNNVNNNDMNKLNGKDMVGEIEIGIKIEKVNNPYKVIPVKDSQVR